THLSNTMCSGTCTAFTQSPKETTRTSIWRISLRASRFHTRRSSTRPTCDSSTNSALDRRRRGIGGRSSHPRWWVSTRTTPCRSLAQARPPVLCAADCSQRSVEQQRRCSALFENAPVLVRLDHVARRIINARRSAPFQRQGSREAHICQSFHGAARE